MIKLYQFKPFFGLPNASVFCMKVETYLRLADIPYETVIVMDPGKSPKGKLPYICDGDRKIADSSFILTYLREKYGDPLGEGLSEEVRADHYILARMLEDHLYFSLVYIRWLKPGNSGITRDAFFASVPSLLRKYVFSSVQKKLRKALKGQGIARHSDEEIEDFAIKGLGAISLKLGDAQFFGGEKPREIDCTSWAMVACILDAPFEGRVKEAAKALPNLVSYNERMWNKVFPELRD